MRSSKRFQHWLTTGRVSCHENSASSTAHGITTASIVYEIIVRFSWDFYETILVGKFPSREISEKRASRRSRITDIQTQSFLPFHRTQRNMRILAVASLSAVVTRRGGMLGITGGITFVTQSGVVTTDSRQRRHCLEHYRVTIAMPSSSSHTPVCVKSFEVYCMQFGWYISAVWQS